LVFNSHRRIFISNVGARLAAALVRRRRPREVFGEAEGSEDAVCPPADEHHREERPAGATTEKRNRLGR
jgi:hypothetical protein